MYGEDLKESGAKSECPFIQNLHDFAPKQRNSGNSIKDLNIYGYSFL